LYEMDYLKDGIGLRSMAQRDPLVEYRNDGHQMFLAMAEAIKEETVGYLFNIEVKRQDEQEETEISRLTTPTTDVMGNGAAEKPAQQNQPQQKKTPARAGQKAAAPQVDALGLEVEKQPQSLSYSSSDGAGGPPQRQSRPQGAVAGGGNREQRRRAARAARRRR